MSYICKKGFSTVGRLYPLHTVITDKEFKALNDGQKEKFGKIKVEPAAPSSGVSTNETANEPKI